MKAREGRNRDGKRKREGQTNRKRKEKTSHKTQQQKPELPTVTLIWQAS